MNQEKLESAKNLFFIALGIDIAVTALVVASDLWGEGILKDMAAGTSIPDQSTLSTMAFWDSFGKVMILTVIGVGLGLVKWLNTCYSFAKEFIGATGFKNERWTAAGWIIPVFNWFKPYQVLNEIFKAGSPTYVTPDDWKKVSGSGLLLTWWVFYAVTHFIGWIASKQMFRSSMRDDITLSQSIKLVEFHILFCVVSLLIAGLWFLVADHLTRRLVDRKRIGLNPILQAQPIAVSQSVPSRNSAPTEPAAPPPGSIQWSARQAAGTTSQAATNAVQFVNQAETPTPKPLSESTEEDFWATAMTEVETGQRRPGVWAKAFAECDGDETKAKVGYLKSRVQQLTEAHMALLAQMEVERQKVSAKVLADAVEQQREMAPVIAKFKSSDYLSISQIGRLVRYATVDPQLVHLTDRVGGNSLLHLCAKNEMIEEVNALLLAGADPNRSNSAGSRPGSLTTNSLILQLCNGLKVSQERLKVMINPPMGFCPNCDDVIPAEVQTCPTCQAMVGPSSSWQVRCLDEVQMVSELKSSYLEKRPTLNQVKYLVAASTRDSTLVSLADPHKYKATLLHWCAHYGLIEQAHVLLAHGANAKAKNSQGRLPYEGCENKELSQVLSRAAELTAAPHAGLLEAVINGNWSSAKTMLDDGVKPTGCDEEDRSLLDHARARNDTLMISLLESYGST